MRWKIITEIKTSMYMNYIINKSKKKKPKVEEKENAMDIYENERKLEAAIGGYALRREGNAMVNWKSEFGCDDRETWIPANSENSILQQENRK